jgi:hypothetical protein
LRKESQKDLKRASQKEELILHCAMSNVLYKKNNFSVTEAMDLLGVDEKIRAVIVMELQQEI